MITINYKYKYKYKYIAEYTNVFFFLNKQGIFKDYVKYNRNKRDKVTYFFSRCFVAKR